MIQDLKYWRRDYRRVLHLAEHTQGIRGFLVRSNHHGCHLGLFIRGAAGLGRRAWCHVELEVPGLAWPLHCYSVHLSARSAPSQLAEAMTLATLIADKPQLAVAGGDWNTFPRGGPAVTSGDLTRLPAHLQVTRCRTASGGGLEPGFAVDDALSRAGLADAEAYLPPDGRTPAELAPTGAGGARVDRIYLSPQLAARARCCRRLAVGSDHQAVLLDLDLTRVTR